MFSLTTQAPSPESAMARSAAAPTPKAAPTPGALVLAGWASTAARACLRSQHFKGIQVGRPYGYHLSITAQSACCRQWGRECAVHPAPQPMPCCPDRHVLQPESGEPKPPGHSGAGGRLSDQVPNWPAMQRSSWPRAALSFGRPAAIMPHLLGAGIEQAKKH
jgi:hypothetical protein